MLLSYFSTKSRNCKYTGRGASRIKRQFCDYGFHSIKIGTAVLTAATIRNGLCISAYFLISIKLRTFGCQKYDFRCCIIIFLNRKAMRHELVTLFFAETISYYYLCVLSVGLLTYLESFHPHRHTNLKRLELFYNL